MLIIILIFKVLLNFVSACLVYTSEIYEENHFFEYKGKFCYFPISFNLTDVLYHSLLNWRRMMSCDFVGIDVGHQFYSRAEMVVVGVHSHWLNGIDYMGVSYAKQVTTNSYVADEWLFQVSWSQLQFILLCI